MHNLDGRLLILLKMVLQDKKKSRRVLFITYRYSLSLDNKSRPVPTYVVRVLRTSWRVFYSPQSFFQHFDFKTVLDVNRNLFPDYCPSNKALASWFYIPIFERTLRRDFLRDQRLRGIKKKNVPLVSWRKNFVGTSVYQRMMIKNKSLLLHLKKHRRTASNVLPVSSQN